MGTYLRWWSSGRPQTKIAVASEHEAQDHIRSKYPHAYFQWRPVSDPSLGADQHILAWSDMQAFHAEGQPVADILVTS